MYHKQKKKIRVVFNCSQKFKGVSLNDNLLSGPDLTNNLYGVLLRFCQEPIAVVSDIQKMFYQVHVPKEHSNYLRFFLLYSVSKPKEYRLRVHVFGSTSSQWKCCKFCSTTNCPEIRSTVLRNFYADDMLKSFYDEPIAINVTNEVKSILNNGGLTLTSFNSNSRFVLNSAQREMAYIFRDFEI